MPTTQFHRDVCVIGGGGHVGLPLAIAMADAGLRTVIYDVDAAKLDAIRAGTMPFLEEGGEPALRGALASGKLELESTPTRMSDCRFIVLVIGTPVDAHLNPDLTGITRALDACATQLRDGQILILRSTIFPGISEHVQRQLDGRGLDVRVAFCPERVVQGKALHEIQRHPQIISGFDAATVAAVRQLFERFCPETVEMRPMEAELAKLMTNAYRYISFATVNQFYMIATRHGLDFDRILHGCKHHYPRMADMPGPGLAAGPCLRKDTMQLAAFSQDGFVLGHAAMMVNEGLPAHLVAMAKQQAAISGRSLVDCTAGILGMAFKAGSDDPRDSLSFKLRKLLAVEAARVLCADPHVPDATLVPASRLMREADVVFVATPHAEYRAMQPRSNQIIVDVWQCLGTAALAAKAVA